LDNFLLVSKFKNILTKFIILKHYLKFYKYLLLKKLLDLDVFKSSTNNKTI